MTAAFEGPGLDVPLPDFDVEPGDDGSGRATIQPGKYRSDVQPVLRGAGPLPGLDIHSQRRYYITHLIEAEVI